MDEITGVRFRNYAPGSKPNDHVDALTRAPNEQPSEIETACTILKITSNSEDWLLTMQLQDPALAQIVAILKGEVQSDQINSIRKDYMLKLHVCTGDRTT